MHVVIIAGGAFHASPLTQAALKSADLVIAADAGAMTALNLGQVPDVIVGDMDSLGILDELKGYPDSEVIAYPPEKDETDTELAIEVAIARGASLITLLGAFGGTRIEHAIANLFLVTAYPPEFVRIVDGPTACWFASGPCAVTIQGKPGDLLSLFPVNGPASGIVTHNLYYPLRGDTLYPGRPRGISNVLTEPRATVTFETGSLLFVQTVRDLLMEN